MTFSEYVLKLAKASGKHYTEIARMAGASEGWAKIYLRGHIADPQVNKIEKLYEGLTGKKLIPNESE